MVEITIEILNYEQRRLEFFKQQKEKAERSMKHWSKKAAGASYLSLAVQRASEEGEKVAFYRDCINAFGGNDND